MRSHGILKDDPNGHIENFKEHIFARTARAADGPVGRAGAKPDKDTKRPTDPFGYSASSENTPVGIDYNDCCVLEDVDVEETVEEEPPADPCSLIEYLSHKGVESTGGQCVRAKKVHFAFRNNPNESFEKWKLDEAKYIKVSSSIR